MTITVRPISTFAELTEFSRCQSIAFGVPFDPENVQVREAIFEYDRSTAAFDGDELVGTAGIFSQQLTVPGGAAVPCAGVTMVSVLPTHRRQGVLSAMMRDQLTAAKARGDVVAALWASESVIYGRFGYGMAAETVTFHIDRQRTTLEHVPEVPGRVRFMSEADAREVCPAVHEQVRLSRPGWITRSQAWWSHRIFRDPPERRNGFTAAHFLQYEVNGDVRGYLKYRSKPNYEEGLPAGTVMVEELVAATDDAYTALWQFAFSLDLVSTIEAGFRPTDEPLRFMLADPRRLQRGMSDSLWVRILDIERALATRRYITTDSLVVEVSDDFLDGVGGRFRITSGPVGSTCERTSDAADLEMTVTDLGTVYLGGVALNTLARAGRVRGEPSAIARADAMFAWPLAPWVPEMF